MNWCSRVSSIAPVRVQVGIRVITCSSSIASMRCAFHSKFFSSTSFTTLYFLVMSCISHRVLPPCVFSRREAVVLCRTSCALVVSGIRVVSRLCSPRMHTLFLASNFALFSSSSSRYLAVSWMSHLFQMGKLVNCTPHLLGNCRSIVDRISSDALIFSSTSFFELVLQVVGALSDSSSC